MTYLETIDSFASASRHAALFTERSDSCTEMTDFYLVRIQTHNPGVHAIVVDNQADAVRTACRRDDDLLRGCVRGALHGAPVTVKEAFNLAGLKTTVNFGPLRTNVAANDALIV